MKKPRFIVADQEVSESLGISIIIMLASVGYWVEHYEELIAWCDENRCTVEGMTVNIPDEQTLVLFTLRWA